MDFNLIIDIISALIVCVIIIAERRQRVMVTADIHLLRMLMYCVLLVFVLDIPGIWHDGNSFHGARTLIWVFDTAYWLVHAVYGWLWLMFADYLLFGSVDHLKKFRWIYAVPMFVETVLVIINPFTGWIFTISEDNKYTVGTEYYKNLIPYFCYIVAAIALTLYGYVVKKSIEQKRRCLILLIFMFLPVCGLILEIFVYGVTWVWPLTALSLLIIYVDVQQQYIVDERINTINKKEQAVKLEKELLDSNKKILLSQIQPHFLYDSLSVIQSLCKSDPQKAKAATKCFSDFLRTNMHSLTLDKLVSFEQELSHTKNYLFLEKLHYGDKINIEYDIDATFFRLPIMSIQPLAENAVRYGVAKRENGGTVRISSHESEDSFVVTVFDDGIELEAFVKRDDGRTNFWLHNVQSRIREKCGGTLCIENVEGVGTTAVVTVPKEVKAIEQ